MWYTLYMIERNIKLFKWNYFFSGLWPLSTLVIIYFQQITHSYAMAMAIFSISSITTTLMEIPTGIFSDKVGRRRTLIYAAITILICFFLWALAGQVQQVWMLFVGAFLWGTSDALLSGTDEALMYETMEELGRKEDFNLLFSKSAGFNQIGLGVSAITAAIITYFYSLQTLAWISVFPIIGELIIALLYVEPKHKGNLHQVSSYKHFLIAFRRLWRNRRLRFYSIVSMLDTSVGMASHRFESAYYETLIPAWMINLARLVKQTCGTIGFFMVEHIRKLGMVRIFFGSMLANVFIRIVGVCMNNFITPFWMGTVNLFYATGQTSGADILQKEFSKEQRATMKSIISLCGGIIMAIMMYLFGFIADISTPRIAIALAILIKLLVTMTSLVILKKSKIKQINPANF